VSARNRLVPSSTGPTVAAPIPKAKPRGTKRAFEVRDAAVDRLARRHHPAEPGTGDGRRGNANPLQAICI